MAIFWRSCTCSKSQESISQANNDAGEARDVEHRSHPYRFHVLEVPTAHLGDHYRHRFDLGRCCEAWVPSTCSGNAPHGLRDPCSHRSVLFISTNTPASANEAGAPSERPQEVPREQARRYRLAACSPASFTHINAAHQRRRDDAVDETGGGNAAGS